MKDPSWLLIHDGSQSTAVSTLSVDVLNTLVFAGMSLFPGGTDCLGVKCHHLKMPQMSCRSEMAHHQCHSFIPQ